MQRVLVVGGSSGIGAALVKKLAHSGRSVVATYNSHTPEPLSNVEFVHLNVLNEELDFSFLDGQISGLVYCPGRIQLTPFHRIKPEEFESDFQLQVMGAIKTLQAAKPMLAEGASVVLFSSVAAQTGFGFHTQVGVSKGALEGLTKALAAEWAPKVRVNIIAPSITDTPLASKFLNTDEKRISNAQRHPMKSIGQPDDVAAMAEFLLSEQARWITGQVLHVDGGMSALRV